MKKVFLALAGLAALAAVSCVRDENPDYVPPPTTVSGVVINEVYTFSNQSEPDDLDWIELYNPTDADIDLTGVLMWESGGQEEAWAFPKGSVIKAKGYFVVDSDKYGLLNDPMNHPAWGLSKGPDEFMVLANSDFKVIDEVKLPSLNEGETYGRITDGSKDWQVFQTGTKGKKNEGPARPAFKNTLGLYINEVYHDNSDVFSASGWDSSVDFIELYNATDADIDISGFEIYDDTQADDKKYVVPAGTKVPAKGFLTYDVYKENTAGPAFGLGASGDWVFIFKPGKSELVDQIEVPAFGKDSGLRDLGYTFGRKPDGSDKLFIFTEATRNASNNNAPVLEDGVTPEQPKPEQPAASTVFFNELCGNEIPDGPKKFIELYNTGDAECSLEGWTIRKYAADATDVAGKYNNCWIAPAGAKLGAGQYLVLEADQNDPSKGFSAGLSAKKGVKFELVDASGKVVDLFLRGEDADPFAEESFKDDEREDASFSRVPNGTGGWAYADPTPGAANGESTGEIKGHNASTAIIPTKPADPKPEKPADPTVFFNELCGNEIPDGPKKFIELYNTGDAECSLEGWTIRKYAADATDVAGKYNNCWIAPAGAKLGAGQYLVLEADQNDPSKGFSAGLSAKKGVKFELVDASGKVVDLFLRGEDADPFAEESFKDDERQDASFSRVPNGTGDWAYADPTPGAANGESTGEIKGYKKN